MTNKLQKNFLLLLPLMFLSVKAVSQSAAGSAAGDPYFYERSLTMMMLILGAFVVVAAIAALFYLLNIMIKAQQIRIYQEEGLDAFLEEVEKQPSESWWSRMYKKMTATVPLEKEEDILFDHEYDGIRELDNSLPPWWVAMFYITIGFAVVYMTYYHFADIGPSSREQYEMEMEQAEKEVQAFLAKQANLVDENSVQVITSEQELALGKSIYDINCIACHGAFGEGGVGPNLTDKYWIHGGSIKDVFKTIKYGVPEKGMISWKAQLRPVEMQNVASYILSMQGTNPENAKEAEGELYEKETDPTASDSTKVEGPIGMTEGR